MSSTSRNRNLADIFCRWFDLLDEEAIANDGDRWRQERLFSQTAKATYEAIVRKARSPDPPATLTTAAGQRRLFAALTGIDWALKHVHPVYAGRRIPELLTVPRDAYRATGRLNHDLALGALVPRLAIPAPTSEIIETRQSAFRYVQRVSPQSCANVVRPSALPGQRLTARHREAGITVGCVPVLESAAQLRVAETERAGRHHYRIALRDGKQARALVDQIVSKLDDDGVELAMAPEMACSAALLRHWEAVLSRADRSPSSNLRWVMVGSGNLHNHRRARNTAALLDGRTGEVIFEQTKQHRFNLSRAQQSGADGYTFPEFSGKHVLHEDIGVSRTLSVLELGAARLAILICEDLDRHEALLNKIHENGVSHILVPVFAKPTRYWFWEHQDAMKYATATGSTTVVGGSLVVGRLSTPHGKLPAALANTTHGSSIQQASGSSDLMRWVIRDRQAPVALDDEVDKP